MAPTLDVPVLLLSNIRSFSAEIIFKNGFVGVVSVDNQTFSKNAFFEEKGEYGPKGP